MNINIKSTTIDLTDDLKDYVDKRLENIKNLTKEDSTVQCDVELARTTNHHKHGDVFKAEIHMVGKDKNIYATAEEEDLYKAIDKVKSDVMREITSSKEKKQSLVRRGGLQIKNIVRGFLPAKKK